MQRAPFYDDVAEGPGKGQAFWIETVDRLKLRAGGWFSEGHCQNGTIFRFPGRGDFLEGSGQIARAFAKFGYGTVANDWRGQGASDRLLKDPYVGHVTDFMNNKKDVRAIFDMARQLELPKPWFVLGSSMGACIALRSLYDAPPISAVIFSAPMWGINLKIWQRRLALPLSRVVHTLGLGHLYALGQIPETAVRVTPFEKNDFTQSRKRYAALVKRAELYSHLHIGGVSYSWLYAALKECDALAKCEAPSLPALTFEPELDSYIDKNAIRSKMQAWPNGRLITVADAKHALFEEEEVIRSKVIDEIFCFLSNFSKM